MWVRSDETMRVSTTNWKSKTRAWSWVTINHGHQLHALVLLFQFVVDTRMVSSERTHTNDCYADCTLVSQANDFLRPARKEQSLR